MRSTAPPLAPPSLRSARAPPPAALRGGARAPVPCGRRALSLRPRAGAASATPPPPPEDDAPRKIVAAPPPSMPVTPVGSFLQHVLSMEPHLFEEAVDAQFARLASEAAEPAADSFPPTTTEVTLYRRIADVKRRARSSAIGDLMFFSVLRKFSALGVDLLPPLSGEGDYGSANLVALTKGVHSAEALELVREHLASVLGGGSATPGGIPPPSAALVRMSKLQAAQVYAASLMFGYFLRRVDARFRLARSMGTLPASQEDTIKALESLFNAPSAEGAGGSGGGAAQSAGGRGGGMDAAPSQAALDVTRKASLRRYVESFDVETMADTARIVSMEGVSLVERQTTGLFGPVEQLSAQMAAAIGPDVQSREDFMRRMASAIEAGTVETVTLPYATQRRLVLEAVAFGAFLRDVEEGVIAKHEGLLTPTRAGR